MPADPPTRPAGHAEHCGCHDAARAQDADDPLSRAFGAACERLVLLRGAAGLVLGCSAGGDSMALLELAAHEGRRRGWRLCVAHLDHAQRPESVEEAVFVEARCAALGVAFLGGRATGLPEGASEDELRKARLLFFKEAVRATDADGLVLAHQADDRAETFIMRLLAGSGPTGLASIRECEELDGMRVLRPLLGVRRDALRAWLAERGLAWREDPGNDDERFKRVWVRRRVLPLLQERMGPNVVPRIVRAGELAQSESAALDQAVGLMLGELTRMDDSADPKALGVLRVDHPLWSGAGAELRRQLMREWLWRLREGPHPPGFAAVEEALGFAERGATGATLRTIERIQIEKRPGVLSASTGREPGHG